MQRGQAWRLAVAKLSSGDVLPTWSARDGAGPEFRIDSASRDAIFLTPLSTGKQRRLVESSFEEVEGFLRDGGNRSDLFTRNASYPLGIMKHLGLPI